MPPVGGTTTAAPGGGGSGGASVLSGTFSRKRRLLLATVGASCIIARYILSGAKVEVPTTNRYQALSVGGGMEASTSLGQEDGHAASSSSWLLPALEVPRNEGEVVEQEKPPYLLPSPYPDDPSMNNRTWARVNRHLTNAPTSTPASPDHPKFVKCREHGMAFGGGWLATKGLMLLTDFPHQKDPEWTVHFMYGKRQRHGRSSLKTLDFKDFFVEHYTGLDHHIKEMDLQGHRFAAPMVRQRAQEGAALCNALTATDTSGPAPHAEEETVVLTYFWIQDQDEAEERNPFFYEVRENYFKATICSANRYFKHFKVFGCGNGWPRQKYNGLTDLEIAERLMPANETLRPGSTIEYIPVECGHDHYFPLMYTSLQEAQRRLRGDQWSPAFEYVLFTEPDQRVEINQGMAAANFARLDDGHYLSPHRLEELYYGKQVDGTFPQYKFDGRLFDCFNWCACKAWRDATETFCVEYIGQDNG